MFVKVILICAVATVALGIEFPPGVNPALCPNYPYCDMELLARYTPQRIPIPEWDYNRLFAARLPVPVIAPVVAKVGAIEYPADVDPASCPNYPYCF